MQSDVIAYLQEVLGVSEVLVPSKAGGQPKGQSDSSPLESLEVSGVRRMNYEKVGASPEILIWIAQEATGSVRELLAKMMDAIQVGGYVLFWGTTEELAGISDKLPRYGINFSGRELQVENLDLRSSLALESLFEGEANQILQNKKRVWEHLKQLKHDRAES